MLKNALRDIVNRRTKRQSSYTKFSSPCLDDHHFKKKELESVGELATLCSQTVLERLYLARIGRPDNLVVGKQTCSISHQVVKSL